MKSVWNLTIVLMTLLSSGLCASAETPDATWPTVAWPESGRRFHWPRVARQSRRRSLETPMARRPWARLSGANRHGRPCLRGRNERRKDRTRKGIGSAVWPRDLAGFLAGRNVGAVHRPNAMVIGSVRRRSTTASRCSSRACEMSWSASMHKPVENAGELILLNSSRRLFQPLVLSVRHLVVGDSVYVQAAAGFCKLDKRTGEVDWRVLSDFGGMFGSAFSSPVLRRICGKDQIVVQTRQTLAGVDPESGKILWSQRIPATLGMNILTPVVIGDHDFYQ